MAYLLKDLYKRILYAKTTSSAMVNSSNSDLVESRERLYLSTAELMKQIQQSQAYVAQITTLVNPSQIKQQPPQKEDLIKRVEKIYIYLEHIALQDASLFSNSGKANLRRAQAELQRMRLSMLDSPL